MLWCRVPGKILRIPLSASLPQVFHPCYRTSTPFYICKMDTNITKASQVIIYLRSCKEETSSPVSGNLKGEIPKWLEGNLIRIGPGILEVGPDHYKHVFDGLAMIHRFNFKDGNVTYKNRFLRSDTYKKNMAANRIIVGEFGTIASPDPCKTIFQRFSSLFKFPEMTDNDLVNIILYGGEPYACSESNYIWKIDQESLENTQKVNLRNLVSVQAAVAHAHEDSDGTIYNLGSFRGKRQEYKLFKVSRKGSDSFPGASDVCSVPPSITNQVGYHHSFGMSENYFVVVEQPLYVAVSTFMIGHIFGTRSMGDALYWDEKQMCRFHVIRRSDGKLLDTSYVAKSFFVFHHINTYEEDDHLVIDMCTFKDGKIVKALYIKALEELFKSNKSFYFESSGSRYVLPLKVNKEDKRVDVNLVQLSNSQATAQQLEDGSVLCIPELLTDTDSWQPELPRINYGTFNGKKYKYFYSVSKHDQTQKTYLLKVDVETKQTTPWSEEGVTPSEPIFVPNPDAKNEDEDFGILLASLLYAEDESKVSMLVLNAKSMQEIGRVTFNTKSTVPADFHGEFISKMS